MRGRIAAFGAAAAGCPTSMWMTWPPAPSIRAAAAITSITMNGGTSLRPEAVSSRFAWSLSVASSIDICYLSGRPILAAFRGLLGHIP